MAKTGNLNAERFDLDEVEDEVMPSIPPFPPISSDDNDEASGDPSLKTADGATIQGCTIVLDDVVPSELKNAAGLDDISSPCSPEDEEAVVDSIDKGKKRKREWKKRKNMRQLEVDLAKEENGAEEEGPISHTVLRKLLRRPRYFDPPESVWAKCHCCGERGHKPENCKQRKPCFICGSFEHNNRLCKKGRYCFICKKGNHGSKDCPDKYEAGLQNTRLCFRCGSPGHNMISCKNDYTPEDLKEIQCYSCKDFGHLCCDNSTDVGPREVSCYKCGQLGHTGVGCPRSRGEATSVGPPNSYHGRGSHDHIAVTANKSSQGTSDDHIAVTTNESSQGTSDDHITVTDNKSSQGTSDDHIAVTTNKSSQGTSDDHIAVTTNESSQGTSNDHIEVTANKSRQGTADDHIAVTADNSSQGVEGEV